MKLLRKNKGVQCNSCQIYISSNGRTNYLPLKGLNNNFENTNFYRKKKKNLPYPLLMLGNTDMYIQFDGIPFYHKRS